MGSEESRAAIGDVIDGRYRLLSMLGQGGMGQVFRAEHVGIKREVAIKLLHSELRDHEGIQERVMREAFATGRLDHPNCVSITDSGMLEGGGTYLVMELLEGDSLGDLLDERETLRLDEVLSITRDILKGLQHAHGVGVVHRDLKPDNIFLVKPGSHDDNVYPVAKILDFGIAKLLGDAKTEAGGGDLTEAGMAIGSPTYMSPEQATGGAIDGRSDLYTLSLIVYEMISGEPPFYEPDDKVRALQRRLKEKAPPIESPLGEEIPDSLQQLVQDGLARDAKDRVATATVYLQRWDAIVSEIAAALAQPVSVTAPVAVVESVAMVESGAVPAPVRTPAPPPSALPSAIPTTIAPVNGLSPEAMKRLRIGGLALLGVVVLVALIAVVTRDAKPQPAANSEETLTMEPDLLSDTVTVDPAILAAQLSQELDRFEDAIDNGHGADQVDPLKKLQTLWPRDARTNYLLGLAYMEKRYWGDGYKYLREAIELDDQLRSEPLLIKSAIRSLSSHSKPGLGEQFLVKVVGKPAIPYLEETIVGGSKRQKKHAERALKQLQSADL